MATSFDLGGLLGTAFGGDEYGDLLTPAQQSAIQQRAMLSAASALLQAGAPSTTRTSLGQALGAALIAGQTGAEKAQQSALTGMLTRQKLEEARREQEREQQFRNALLGMSAVTSPALTAEQALALPGMAAGPTVERAALVGQPAPAGVAAQGASQLTPQQISLLSTLPRKEAAAEILKLTKQPEPTEKTKLLRELGLPPTLENLRLLERPEAAPEKIRTLQALGMPITIESLRQLEKPEASPSEVRILEATGTPVTLQNVMNLRRSGASSTQVDVRLPGNQQFLAGIGTNVAETLGNLTTQARAANDTLATIERIRPALGTAVTGPAAEYRTTMLRIGQQLGVGGQNEAERLTNTRTLVQGLAQMELDAAAGMKGQGQLTDTERAILRRAAAGDQTLSAPELTAAMNAAEKVANRRIEIQRQYLEQARQLPGFQQFAPLYQVTPPQGAGGGRGGAPSMTNAIDAELQRRQQQQPRGR